MSFLLASWPLRLVCVAGSLFALLAAFTALGYAIQRAFAGRRIFAVPLRRGQERRELRNAIVFNAVATLAFTALLTPGLVPWSGGWSAGVVTFLAGWVGFEVYYYVLHRAMHTRALIRFHREHHESHVNTPMTAFSMSLAEGLGWIVGYVSPPLLLALLGAPVSLAGFAAYLIYNYWGNIIGHVNVEVVPGSVGRRANSWAMHAITYHALHHARYTGHYGFGATFMDRLFGTEWNDWPALQARVLGGRAMTSLKHRG